MKIIVDVFMGGILPFVLLTIAGYLIKTYRDANVIKWVKIAVEAAEQIYKHGENKKKFEYVKNWISDKFKISDKDLKNIIESAVYNLKGKDIN